MCLNFWKSNRTKEYIKNKIKTYKISQLHVKRRINSKSALR